MLLLRLSGSLALRFAARQFSRVVVPRAAAQHGVPSAPTVKRSRRIAVYGSDYCHGARRRLACRRALG